MRLTQTMWTNIKILYQAERLFVINTFLVDVCKTWKTNLMLWVCRRRENKLASKQKHQQQLTVGWVQRKECALGNAFEVDIVESPHTGANVRKKLTELISFFLLLFNIRRGIFNICDGMLLVQNRFTTAEKGIFGVSFVSQLRCCRRHWPNPVL